MVKKKKRSVPTLTKPTPADYAALSQQGLPQSFAGGASLPPSGPSAGPGGLGGLGGLGVASPRPVPPHVGLKQSAEATAHYKRTQPKKKKKGGK